MSVGPTVCPLCKVAYPHGFTREMTEDAFRRCGQQISMFVGLLGFSGNSDGIGKWGWVWNPKTLENYLLCGKCYAPVENAYQDGSKKQYDIASKLALQCT
jgi:hypothetical protein